MALPAGLAAGDGGDELPTSDLFGDEAIEEPVDGNSPGFDLYYVVVGVDFGHKSLSFWTDCTIDMCQVKQVVKRSERNIEKQDGGHTS